MVGLLVKLAEVRGAELDRTEGKGMRELKEKRRGTSGHLYLPQHQAGRLGDSDTMPGRGGR
jgi:hypothetical protein